MEPFASLVTTTRFDVPRVLINREAVGLFRHRGKRTKDVVLIGDLVGQVRELARLAGWLPELEQLMPPMQDSKEEEEEVKGDITSGESPHSSAPASDVGDACSSDQQQPHQEYTPQQEEEGIECPPINDISGSSLEQVRQALDELHIQKKNSTEDKDDDR